MTALRQQGRVAFGNLGFAPAGPIAHLGNIIVGEKGKPQADKVKLLRLHWQDSMVMPAIRLKRTGVLVMTLIRRVTLRIWL